MAGRLFSFLFDLTIVLFVSVSLCLCLSVSMSTCLYHPLSLSLSLNKVKPLNHHKQTNFFITDILYILSLKHGHNYYITMK